MHHHSVIILNRGLELGKKDVKMATVAAGRKEVKTASYFLSFSAKKPHRHTGGAVVCFRLKQGV